MNFQDARDAVRDFDYDRVSNLDEYNASTEPNTDWTFIEIPDLSGRQGGVASLNDVGEFIRIDGNTLKRWQGDYWNSRTWVSQGSFGTALQIDFLLHNNFGLAVAWQEPVNSLYNGSEAWVRDISTSTNYTIAPPGATYVEVLRITDSGFIYGRYINSAGKRCLFRYHEGKTVRFEDSAGSDIYYRAGNRRGEILASFGGYIDVRLFAGGKWYTTLANQDTMVVTDAGDLVDVSGGANGMNSSRWFSNAYGDLLRGVRLDWLDTFPNDPQTGSFYAPGFTASEIFDADPINSPDSRPVVPLDLSPLGETVGKVHYNHPTDLTTIDIGDPDDDTLTYQIQVGDKRGFLWRPGNFHLGPGLSSIPNSYDSELHRTNRTGAIATTYWQLQSINGPNHPYDDYVSVYGVLVPQNDADGDDMADPWEIAHFGDITAKDGTADSDLDGLSDHREYVFNTDPNLADSDDDGMDDIVELQWGMDPNQFDSDEDIDGDGLDMMQEFFYGTSPYHFDTDGDGEGDGYEIENGGNPLNILDFVVDTDGDLLPDAWEIEHVGPDLTLADAAGDVDQDGLPNLWEFLNGFDPSDGADALEDWDGDGLNNLDEYTAGSFLDDPDSDDDGLNDQLEVQVYMTNPRSSDTDQDGLTDEEEINDYPTSATDNDSDDDGLSDGDEVNLHSTDPMDADSDNDGMPDGWEITYNLDPNVGTDAASSLDSDGLSNLEEYVAGTDPTLNDTDEDGLDDDDELNIYMTDPTDADSDDDGLSDGDEILIHLTDANDNDSDNDGMLDGWEIEHGFAPNDGSDAALDSDGDGISNLNEYLQGKDPNDYYNGFTPTLEVVSGNFQIGVPGLFLEQPLVVKVTDSFGSAHANAPLSFTVVLGQGLLAESNAANATLSATIDIIADANGVATVYFESPSSTSTLSRIEASVDGADAVSFWSATRDEAVSGTDSDGDGVSDVDEQTIHFTNPESPDSDGDGIDDGVEIAQGTDPNDASSSSVSIVGLKVFTVLKD